MSAGARTSSFVLGDTGAQDPRTLGTGLGTQSAVFLPRGEVEVEEEECEELLRAAIQFTDGEGVK